MTNFDVNTACRASEIYRERFGESDERSTEIGERVASLLSWEQLYALRYDAIDKKLADAVMHRTMIDKLLGRHPTPTSKLIKLNDHISRSYEPVTHPESKGVSLTLDSVEQLGSWKAGEPLDARFRTLPNSAALHQAGFEFSETYSDKSTAPISYSLLPVLEFGGRRSVMAIRKRAAADIHTRENNKIEVIKRSSLLLDDQSLSRVQKRMVIRALRLTLDGVTPDAALDSEIGEEIIEPFIDNEQMRDESSLLLPVASSYFALHRRDDTR